MKHPNYSFAISILFSFLIISCSIPDLENSLDENIDNNSLSLSIPDGFDFKTHEEVIITITDNSEYAKYDIFIYSSEPVFIGNQTYENESGEIVTEPVYRNGAIDKLVFSGVPHNGVLTQTINVPTYSDKIYIRRNSKFNYSSSVETLSLIHI